LFFKNEIFLSKGAEKIYKVGKSKTKGKIILKKTPPKTKTSTAGPKAGPYSPDQKSGYTHRRSPRKKGRKNSGIEASPAVSAGTALEEIWAISQFKVAPVEGKTRFHDFDLPAPLLHGICDLGFEYCTPIQAEILPSSLSGKDANGRAQTGTGKTAAFLITVITRMLLNPIQGKRKPGTPRVLIIAPTRELVLQISEEARQLSKYCGLKIVSVFGGMDYVKQRTQVGSGPGDIIVATPGRV